MANFPEPLKKWSLPGHEIGSNIILYDTVTSTMDFAWSAVEEKCRHGTVIVSHYQSRGRGRFGREWVSGHGESFMSSLVLYPDAHMLHQLPIVAALAVLSSIKTITGIDCTVKWPNDIRINGKKIAGILVEVRATNEGDTTAVIGIGLNLNMQITPRSPIKNIATSLYNETGVIFDFYDVCNDIISNLNSTYAKAVNGENLVDIWRTYLDSLGQYVQIKSNDEVISGFAEDVNEKGHLILRKGNGDRISVASGEVTMQV